MPHVFAHTETQEIPTKDILSWIFDKPEYDENKPVLIDAVNPQRFLSLSQSRTIIRKLIAGFQHHGLQRSDCVCIHSFNDIYYPLIFLAIVGAGGIFAGTNPAYTSHEIAHHLKTAKIRFVLSEPEILAPMKAACDEPGVRVKKRWIFNVLDTQTVPASETSWHELLTHGEADWVRFNDLHTQSTTIAARLFSSGTTGLPKAAQNSHRNFVAQHELVFAGPNTTPYAKTDLFALPFFHAAIAPRVHTSVLKTGWPAYVMRRFDLEVFMRSIEKYGVTNLSVVPPLVIAMLMSPLAKKYSLRSIVAGGSGAAPLGKAEQARLVTLLGPVQAGSACHEAGLAVGARKPFTQVWGMTETTCIASMLRFPREDATGSVGAFLPLVDAKLVDAQDGARDVSAYDVQGELCVRGPIVIPGYFENDAANRESFDEDGFFHTGDIAYCSSRNRLWYIVDRKKELIKVRGFQVAPAEVESVLLGHPEIVDCAVIGVKGKDELRESELPRAYVVRKPGSEAAKRLTEEDVYEFTKEKLASFKRLDGGVKFVDAIPKNAAGKILKRVLREEYKKEQGVESKL